MTNVLNEKGWMRLSRPIFFWRSLIYKTSFEKCSFYQFDFSDGRLAVKNGSNLIVSYAGESNIVCNGLSFVRGTIKSGKWFGGIVTLSSKECEVYFKALKKKPDGASYTSNKDFLGLTDRLWVEATTNRSHEEKYLIGTMKHSLYADVIVESSGSESDPMLMILCLAYQWTNKFIDSRSW